jgi:hypothetical protein
MLCARCAKIITVNIKQESRRRSNEMAAALWATPADDHAPVAMSLQKARENLR